MNVSGLATLRAGSSVMKSVWPTLDGLLENPASDPGGLDLELAALRKPELDTESSDRPESDGV